MGVWNIEIERRPWKDRKMLRNGTGGSRTSVVLKLGLGWGCTGEWDEKPGRRINNGRLEALFEKPILKLNTVYTNDNTLNRTCYKRKYK